MSEKIEIRNTERKIYEIQLKEKNNRFANIFKVLLLREDFYEFLSNLKKAHDQEDQNKLHNTIEQFLNNLQKTKYFSLLHETQKNHFLNTAKNLFAFYYPHCIFSDYILQHQHIAYDPMPNYPGIHHNIFYEEIFNKYFPYELYKYGMPPINPPKEEDKPKIVQLIFDETVKKEEVIQYINTFWEEIRFFLSKEEKDDQEREKSSKKFLRDVDIYNRYQELTNLPILTREIEVAKEFEVSAENVRKIVENTRILKEKINTPSVEK
jgi:hypothetical protein